MVEPPIPLVWAKLQPPRPPVGVVERNDLVTDLVRPRAALTAIVAPAGYGKTTLAAQVADRLDADLAWLSLESADDDPARLLTYLAASLCHAGIAGCDAAYEQLASGADGVAAASLTLRAAVEQHRHPVVLVLDDVQAVGDAVIEATMGDWLRHPLADLRIVAASRHDLPLPVGRLRSQGLLTEARIGDLAFDRNESAELLAAAFGLGQLTADQLAALERRTEGWPVGLYLAGLTLRDEPDMASSLARFTGDTRHLDEYLAAEAMDGLSDDDRAFALATSILSTLPPDLCDAVTDGAGSLRVLRRLAAENVFTEVLDDGATVFRYHPLFREHLTSSLRENHPEQVARLHDRASRWFEGRGDVEEAIEHAVASGDTSRAESLVLHSFLRYANAGHFGTVANWVDGLGPRRELRPEMAVVMAWLSLNVRRYDDLDRWLELAAAGAVTPAELALVEIHTPAVDIHRARHLGDVEAMLANADRALEADRSIDWSSASWDGMVFGEDEGRMAARSASASALYWAGRPDEASRLVRDALAVNGDATLTLERVFCYQYLAMAAADVGDHEEALAHADQAIALVTPSQEPSHLPVLAHLARSIALSGMGQPLDAAEALDTARRIAGYRREPLNDAAIELQHAVVLHQTTEIEAARAALRTARSIIDELPDPRFDERIRATENAIRFVAPDADALPVGARELTDRERAVLVLLPHQLSRRELARQLHVSENTVKTHLTSIRHKLGVTGRASIVERAVDLGLIPDVEPTA
ncbi:MAG: LuxR C-terminal-related transcriptional regulator [Actinomycetota bacterium]